MESKSNADDQIGSGEYVSICSICEIDIADVYCPRCQDSLCQRCQLCHSKSKYTSDHKVLPIEKIESPSSVMARGSAEAAVVVNKCVVHPSENIKWSCATCTLLVCLKCKPLHHGHALICAERDDGLLTKMCMNNIQELLQELRFIEDNGIDANHVCELIKCSEDELERVVNLIKTTAQAKSDAVKKFLKKIKDQIETVADPVNLNSIIDRLVIIRRDSDAQLKINEIVKSNQVLTVLKSHRRIFGGVHNVQQVLPNIHQIDFIIKQIGLLVANVSMESQDVFELNTNDSTASYSDMHSPKESAPTNVFNEMTCCTNVFNEMTSCSNSLPQQTLYTAMNPVPNTTSQLGTNTHLSVDEIDKIIIPKSAGMYTICNRAPRVGSLCTITLHQCQGKDLRLVDLQSGKVTKCTNERHWKQVISVGLGYVTIDTDGAHCHLLNKIFDTVYKTHVQPEEQLALCYLSGNQFVKLSRSKDEKQIIRIRHMCVRKNEISTIRKTTFNIGSGKAKPKFIQCKSTNNVVVVLDQIILRLDLENSKHSEYFIGKYITGNVTCAYMDSNSNLYLGDESGCVHKLNGDGIYTGLILDLKSAVSGLANVEDKLYVSTAYYVYVFRKRE